jgi:hypothetical protein
MNPRDDTKSMTKIVAKAMIDSLDHEVLRLCSRSIWVPVTVSLCYMIHYSFAGKAESIPLMSCCSDIFDIIAVKEISL